MLVVLIFLGIMVVLLSLTFVLILSTIKISIENVSISNYDQITKDITNNRYSIKISLYLLNKIKIFTKKLSNKNIKNKYKKLIKEKIDIDQIKRENLMNKENLDILRKLEIKISKLNLNVEIGTEDIFLTTGIVFILSTIISIILPRLIEKYEEDKYKYQIHPIYKDDNLFKIDLDCIISVKMVHIIYIIYIVLQRKRVDKNDRTSNRRAYDYSYE